MPETRNIPEYEQEQTAVQRAEPIVRSVIAGHPQGAIRRNLLYVVAIVSVVLSGLTGYGIVFAVIAVVALLLLALTDQLS